MAIAKESKSLKAVIKCTKTSQSITGLKKTATDQNIYDVAKAVAPLLAEEFEEILRVEESYLIQE